MSQDIKLLETKEDALAAGIPEDVFDPEVHLFKHSEQTHTPIVAVNAVAPTAPAQGTNNGKGQSTPTA